MIMAGTGRTKAVAIAVKGKPEKTRPDYARSAQDRFLTELAQDHRKVVIFLTNGIKLEGEIKSFDDYAILLEGAMTDHVYKHAVSTIQPLTDVVAKARDNVRERAPRGNARATARSAEDAAVVAAGDEVTSKAERPQRQPVIVVRPKRRLVRTVAGKD
jgi:host factor-I protein